MIIGAAARLVRSIVMAGLTLIALAGCSSSPAPPGIYKLGQPYQVGGRWYYPEYDPDYDRTGIASWYASTCISKRGRVCGSLTLMKYSPGLLPSGCGSR